MSTQKLLHCRLPADSRGSILILTFWALSLLSLFAIYMGQGVRQKLSLMDRLIGRSQLYAIAEAGARRGEVELRKADSEATTDSLKEPWAQARVKYKDVKVGEGLFSLDIVDEERKININTVGLDVLKRLFREVANVDDAIAEEIASAVIEWREADSARFNILDELLLVRGVTATIYNSVKYHLTIYGQGKINVNTASVAVLMALGLDKKLVDNVVLFRVGKDGVEGTEDDNIFASSTSIVPQLSQFTPLNPGELTFLSQFASSGLVSTVSEYFTVFAQAGYGYKKGAQNVTCVFQRIPQVGGGYATVLKYWRIAQ